MDYKERMGVPMTYNILIATGNGTTYKFYTEEDKVYANADAGEVQAKVVSLYDTYLPKMIKVVADVNLELALNFTN